MNRLILPSACILAAAASFAAAQHLYAGPLPSLAPVSTNVGEGQDLPNPRLLARASRVELQAVPLTVWAFGATAPTAFVSAMPSPTVPQPVFASASNPPRMPNAPAPVVTQQEVPLEIARALAHSISAIVRSNGVARLVVADPATTVRRSMAVGDIYQAGWKISQIEQNSVTLSKQGRVIRVAISYSATPKRMVAMSGASPVRVSPADSVQSATTAASSARRRRISRRDTSGTSK